jgi:hypothetical protein
MKQKAKFNTHERLMLKVGEGWVIQQRRVNHLITRCTMKHHRHGEDPVPEQPLAKLTTLGWLRAVPADALWDVVNYEVTDLGQRHLAKLWEAEGEKR